MRRSEDVGGLGDLDELMMYILEGSGVGLNHVCCLLIRRQKGDQGVKRSPEGVIIEERRVFVFVFLNEMIANEVDVGSNTTGEEEDSFSSVEHGVPPSVAWIENLQRRVTNTEEGLLKLDLAAEELIAFECGKEETEGFDHRLHRFQSHNGLHTQLNGVSSAWDVEEKGQRCPQLPVQRSVDGFVVGDDSGHSHFCLDQ
jgi:hypothetical protein